MGPAEYRAILAGIGLILDSLPAISAASKGWTEEERRVARDETAARQSLDAAIAAAREAGQREWVWRALESRGEIAEAAGQSISARRDREDALAVLEEIGARLPRDLREVYWNDERRCALRDSVKTQLGHASTEHLPSFPASSSTMSQPETQLSPSSHSITEMGRTPLEQRLARLLEINAELAGDSSGDERLPQSDPTRDHLNAEKVGESIESESEEDLAVHAEARLDIRA